MAESIRVLHVDDQPAFAETVAAFLEREADRIDVVTAESGPEGLKWLPEVDCVVSDYRMPGMDGLEFLDAVRETHPDLPFILFTGQGSEEVAGDALSAGATDYLRKGPGAERYALLANRIRNAVSRYRTERRAEELQRVRTLIGEVNRALVRADTREAIERRVCEIVSETRPYRFAWIGEDVLLDGVGGPEDYDREPVVDVLEELQQQVAVLDGAVDTDGVNPNPLLRRSMHTHRNTYNW